ncbi:MAG TPA: helix-turn-helix transcriptional regulator [Gemmatimonadales bacterium]|nr:helix-turn-helix transcriptional regulator [Gemmatimonadales bacterium]
MRERARRPTRKRDKEPTVYKVGDNIFADLGRPNADELLAKAELARAVQQLIAKGGLTQAAAAAILGISQPDVSNLHRGRLAGFSMERLYRFLNALGQDVQIVVQPKPLSHARATIRARVQAT